MYFLLLTSMYVPSLILIPLVLSKIWPGQASIMENGYGEITQYIYILVHCTSSYCHLSINQVSFQSLLYFPRYGPDRHQLCKIWLMGDNYVAIQGMIMVLVYATSTHCHISINQVSFKCQEFF